MAATSAWVTESEEVTEVLSYVSIAASLYVCTIGGWV